MSVAPPLHRPTRRVPTGQSPQEPLALTGNRRRALGNRIFAGVSTGAAIVILIVLAAVAGFLLVRAWPALTVPVEQIAGATGGKSFWAYVAPLAFGTVLASVIALAVAVPLSIGVALFISHYAPRRLAQGLGYLIDLLAAIPSVIFGLWGMAFLQPVIDPLFQWLSTHLGFVPFFTHYQAPARNLLAAGRVLAVLTLPLITATTLAVIFPTPRLHKDASRAP